MDLNKRANEMKNFFNEKIDGYDVYKYTSGKGYENVIFNGNSGKTQDLAWTDGKYYVYNSKNSNNPY